MALISGHLNNVWNSFLLVQFMVTQEKILIAFQGKAFSACHCAMEFKYFTSRSKNKVLHGKDVGNVQRGKK